MNEQGITNLKNVNQSRLNYEAIVKNYFTKKKGLISVLEASKFFALPQNQKKTEKDIIAPKNNNFIIQRKLKINRNINVIPKEDLKIEYSKTNKIRGFQYHSCHRLSAKNRLKKQNNLKELKNKSQNMNSQNFSDEKIHNLDYLDRIIIQNNIMLMNNIKKFYQSDFVIEPEKKITCQNLKNNIIDFHNTLPLISSNEKDILIKDYKESRKELYENYNDIMRNSEKDIKNNIKNRLKNICISRDNDRRAKNKNKIKNLNNTAINKFNNIKKEIFNLNMKTLPTPLFITPKKERFVFNFYVNKTYRKQIPLYMKHRINWRLVTNKEEGYSLRWKYFPGRVNYKLYQYTPETPIEKIKMISVFEKYRNVGNKETFFINFIKYCSRNQINAFDYIPFTIILNKSFLYEKSLKNLEVINNIIDNKRRNYLNNEKIPYTKLFPLSKLTGYSNKDFEDLFIYINEAFTSDYNYWIVKPPDLFQGMGIKVFKDFKEINEHCQNLFKGIEKVTAEQEEYCKKNNVELKPKIHKSNYILIQKYLDNPLLYYGRKFDIRCYVLVDYCFNVFICREGHLKACSQKYDLNNLDIFTHITNYSLQKRCKDFAKYEQGNEISFKQFIELLDSTNKGKGKKIFNKIFEKMKEEIQLSMSAVGRKLKGVPKVLSFQIFGYDFIVDQQYNPWILEINDNPGIEISSKIISYLIPRMIDDALRLTVDKVFPTEYDNEVISKDGYHYNSKYHLEGYNNEENLFEFICNIDQSFHNRENNKNINIKNDKK